MRKPTIKSLKHRLDKVCSKITRSRGYCVAQISPKCTKELYSELDTAHIVSRKYNSLRFDLDNLLCICGSCHSHFHDNPLLFADFCRGYLGKAKYESLKIRGNETKQWKIWELQSLLTQLEKV